VCTRTNSYRISSKHCFPLQRRMGESVLGEIELEVRSLCEKAKKKFPDIKTQGELAIARLREAHGRAEPEVVLALASDTVLRPLLASCQTKAAPVSIHALAAIQKLLSVDSVKLAVLGPVTGALRVLAETKEEVLQVKTLQTLAFLSFPAAEESKNSALMKDALCQGLGICFKLCNAESPVTRNAASATLRQILSHFLDQTKQFLEPSSSKGEILDDIKSIDETKTETPVTVSYQVLSDFCLMLLGEKPQWLGLSSAIPKALAAEILEQAVESHSKMLTSHRQLLGFLKEMGSALNKLLRTAASDFPFTLRVFRLITTLSTKCYSSIEEDIESFLVAIIRLLDLSVDIPYWHRILALESVRKLVSSPSLLFFLHTRFDSPKNDVASQLNSTKILRLLGSLVFSLGRIIQHCSQAVHSRNPALVVLKIRQSKDRGLDMLQDFSIPAYDDLHHVFLCLESLVIVSTSIETLVSNCFGMSAPLTLAQLRTEAKPALDHVQLQQLIDICWTPLFSSISWVLDNTTDYEHSEYLFQSCVSMGISCGITGLSKSRNEFLKILCRHSLPYSFRVVLNDGVLGLVIDAPDDRSSWTLSFKNMGSLRCLFRVIEALGTILDGSWLIIFETLEYIDKIVQQHKDTLDSQDLKTSSGSSRLSLKAERGSLISRLGHEDYLFLGVSINKIFQQSSQFSDSGLSHLISSLGTLSLSSLANAATEEKEELSSAYAALKAVNSNPLQLQIPSLEALAPPNNMFSLIGFVQTLEWNMFRISKIWSFTVGHLNCVINHKVFSIRTYGVQSLSRLTKLALQTTQKSVDPLLTNNETFLRSLFSDPLIEEPVLVVASPFEDSEKSFEEMVLNPFIELFRTKYSDTRRTILAALYDIIQAAGPKLALGWKTVFQILQDNISPDASVDPISIGFKILQLILEEFLDS